MDIIDRNQIRHHPAALLAHRAAARRQAAKPSTQVEKHSTAVEAPAIQLAPCLTDRDFLYSDITGAWLDKYPNYPLYHSLIKFHGCIHLWQLTDAQMREFLDAITK